ncbi:MAG: oligosaccharide flippase family protein [Anaerolineales bacterium]|nr:oligosaccharide flippase family protein [Anaerolineales bacterium]
MFRQLRTSLREDNLLRRVLRNSFHLFGSNTISLGLSVLQSALVFHLLAVGERGVLRIVMSYAATVNTLFSFRLSELIVRYGGEYLETGERQKASALMKAASLAEAIVSLFAFLIVALTSGWASENIAKTPGVGWMFIFYAIGLLANFNTETSLGVLQITRKIRLQGIINLVQSLITFSVIAAAFVLKGSIEVILFAYLLSKAVFGVGMFSAARIQLQRALGAGWWRQSLSALTARGEIARFAISSNISATISKVFRESEILWVGFFISPVAAGYYDAALTIVGFLSLPADVLIVNTYPEINRLIVLKAWTQLKDFLRKVTSIAVLYNAALAIGLALFGRLILQIYSGEQYVAAAYPALIVLLVGLAFNYSLYWNRSLLLSLGMPQYPVWVTLIVGLIKIGLAFLIVPRYGIVAAGALLSFYYIATVVVQVRRGRTEIINRARRQDV